MTVKECVDKILSLRPGTPFDESDALRWINVLEADVQTKVLLMPYAEVWYEPGVDDDEELIAPPPYDEMYIYYGLARIDDALSEHASYANAIDKHNEIMRQFKKWVINQFHPAKNAIRLKRSVPEIIKGKDKELTLTDMPFTNAEIISASFEISYNANGAWQTISTPAYGWTGNTVVLTIPGFVTKLLPRGSVWLSYTVTDIDETQHTNLRFQRLYVIDPKKGIKVM